MSLKYVYETSRLIHKLVQNGYVVTNLSKLLCDLKIHDYSDGIIKMLMEEGLNLHCMDVDLVLSIFDELDMGYILHGIMTAVKPYSISNVEILNAKISNYDDLISVCDKGYRVVSPITFDQKTTLNDLANNPTMQRIQQINNACNNGLYLPSIMLTQCPKNIISHNTRNNIQNVRVHNTKPAILIKILRSFPNIDTLSAYTTTPTEYHRNVNHDAICAFTKNIRSLTTTCMGDAWLNAFANLKILDVSCNDYITTCNMFAKTLVILEAVGSQCTLSDNGIKLCTKIKSLTVTNNVNITTCDPFPNIKIVHADDRSGICDSGLLCCRKIRLLSVSNNPKVTTCAPFAKSLKILYAKNDHCGQPCGINDNSIVSCTNLKYLYTNRNPHITTCIPFGHTLEVLHAEYNSGITDDALRICVNLRKISCVFNNKITFPLLYPLRTK